MAYLFSVLVRTIHLRFEVWAACLGPCLFLPSIGGVKSVGPCLAYGTRLFRVILVYFFGLWAPIILPLRPTNVCIYFQELLKWPAGEVDSAG